MQGYNNDITFEDEMQCYDLYFPAFGHSNHPFLPLLVFVCNRIFTLIKLDIFSKWNTKIWKNAFDDLFNYSPSCIFTAKSLFDLLWLDIYYWNEESFQDIKIFFANDP